MLDSTDIAFCNNEFIKLMFSSSLCSQAKCYPFTSLWTNGLYVSQPEKYFLSDYDKYQSYHQVSREYLDLMVGC